MNPKFKLGDLVRKIKGSEWHGTVVGTYSTSLTPEGYAVESATERGSVQIYPAAALEALKAEIEALRAEVESLRTDAERYRWLRDKGDSITVCDCASDGEWIPLHPQNIDATIDAAMKTNS